MTFLEATLTAITQAITELYPISSSGHLILLSEFLNIEPTVSLLTSLHLGSAMALLVIYRKEVWEAIFGQKRGNKNILINYIIAIIPAGLAGILLADKVEEMLYGTVVVAINLILWGFVMIFVEQLEQRQRLRDRTDVTYKDSVVIGIAQVLSLIPGTSRSGITTITGMLSGIRKDISLDFSFMIGIPLLFGAFFYESVLGSEVNNLLTLSNFYAVFITFVVSIVALKFLRSLVKRKFLTFFGIYRIALGSLLLLFFQ